MQRLIAIVISIALVFVAGIAQAEELETSLDIGVGYRMDEVDWNISGILNATFGFVDPISELEWKDLTTIYSKASIRMSYKKFYVRGSLGYGRIIDSDVRDSDYAVSGRQSEFSRAIANTDGYVFDSSISLGYQLASGEFTAIPLIGYSWHLQYLEINAGTQVLCDTAVDPTCTTGSIAGLNSTYEPRWQGPWVGLDISLQPSDEARLFLTAEYHFGDYRANAYWNLRNLRFEHIADAEGFVIAAGFTYTVKDSWDIGLESQYSRWEADAGIDVELTSGVPGMALLNEVNWESIYVMLNVTHRFYDLNNNTRLSSL
jgi:hypothetical protein